MGRILVLVIAMLLPFGVYLLWLSLSRRKEALAAEGRLPAWQALPWTWLIVSGVLLLVATLLAMRIFDIDPDAWIGGESVLKG
jgi:uncharacterized BrkB/YihY/UPF0761 family membrane protein